MLALLVYHPTALEPSSRTVTSALFYISLEKIALCPLLLLACELSDELRLLFYNTEAGYSPTAWQLCNPTAPSHNALLAELKC